MKELPPAINKSDAEANSSKTADNCLQNHCCVFCPVPLLSTVLYIRVRKFSCLPWEPSCPPPNSAAQPYLCRSSPSKVRKASQASPAKENNRKMRAVLPVLTTSV